MPFSQPLHNAFRNCEINVTVLRSGTRVPKSFSQLRNTLRNGIFVAKSGLYHFVGRFAAAKWGLLCCEVALVCQTRLRSCENSRRESQSVAEWFGNKMLISQKFPSACEISQNFVFPLFLLYFCSDFDPIFFFQSPWNFFHLESFKKIKTHIKTWFKIKCMESTWKFTKFTKILDCGKTTSSKPFFT